MHPIPVRLEMIDRSPALDPAPGFPADAGPASRRGAMSFAQHAKLASRLYLQSRPDSGVATIKLPSGTGAVAFDESGRCFMIDKQGEEISELDLEQGTARSIMRASDGYELRRAYASHRTIWLSEGRPVAPGRVDTEGARVHRLVEIEGAWQRTHSGTLALTAGAFAGIADLLVVLEEGGDITAYAPSADTDEILRYGTRGENFTSVVEWEGKVLALSYWDKSSAWVVDLDRTATASPSLAVPPAALRMSDLPGELREQLLRALKDFAADLARDAAVKLGSGQPRDRREARLRAAGEAAWSSGRDMILSDLAQWYSLEIGEQLAAELQQAYVSIFEDATA